MDYFFKILGGLLAAYTIHAVFAGEIYAKRGAWGHAVSRRDSPTYFWAIVAIYSALSLALVTVF